MSDHIIPKKKRQRRQPSNSSSVCIKTKKGDEWAYRRIKKDVAIKLVNGTTVQYCTKKEFKESPEYQTYLNIVKAKEASQQLSKAQRKTEEGNRIKGRTLYQIGLKNVTKRRKVKIKKSERKKGARKAKKERAVFNQEWYPTSMKISDIKAKFRGKYRHISVIPLRSE